MFVQSALSPTTSRIPPDSPTRPPLPADTVHFGGGFPGRKQGLTLSPGKEEEIKPAVNFIAQIEKREFDRKPHRWDLYYQIKGLKEAFRAGRFRFKLLKNGRQDIVGVSAIEYLTPGTPGLAPHNTDNAVYLHFLYLAKPHRGQGLGKWLARDLLAAAKRRGTDQVYLKVHNPDAMALYGKLGFRTVDRSSWLGNVDYLMRWATNGPVVIQ